MSTSEHSETVAIRATYVLPIVQPLIRDGIVLIRDGTVRKLGSAKQILRSESFDRIIDLEHTALLPGLVNAHTHLEFSDLKSPIGEQGIAFAQWVREVVQTRRNDSDDRSSRVKTGLLELESCGTSLAGEISTQTLVPRAKPDVAACFELIGLSADRIAITQEAAVSHLELFENTKSQSFAGLSPHSPYSCHREMVDWACKLSVISKFPVAMHLAETREELQLLADQTGPLRQMLEGFGAWDSDAFCEPLAPQDYLQNLSKAWRALVVHGNYLTATEQAFLAEHADNLTVVYCPRTHSFFEHERYPLEDMLKTGVRVALGTDSRASSPDLSIWNEAKHVLSHHTSVAPERVLEMITRTAAKGLGADQYGVIAPNSVARFASVALPENSLVANDSSLIEQLIQQASPVSVIC